MNTYFLLLGSNIDKEVNLPRAVAMLADRCAVEAVSNVYETAPVGTLDQPPFFNAAVRLRSPLEPTDFRESICVAVESALKRTRKADKNAPRTIDVDIVLYNDAVVDYAGRHLPDPDLLRFAHVALPVAELAPTMPHPETGEPLQAIADRLRATAPPGYPDPPPIRIRSDIFLALS